MHPRRLEKLKRMVSLSQLDFSVCLENVHDPHNISAVMRSCDAVGIREIYILSTDPNLQELEFAPGKRSASGSSKWVSTVIFHELEPCVQAIKKKYDRLLTTHLGLPAQDLYEINLVPPCCLVFGNEKDGLSQDMMEHSDGNFIIPHMGMVPSLNISVACAISLFESMRQRRVAGKYQEDQITTKEKQMLIRSHIDQHKG